MSGELRELDRPASNEGDVNVAEYWAVLKRRWRLVLSCLLVSAAVGSVYAFMAVPLYRAAMTLKVEPEKMNSLDLGFNTALYAYYSEGQFLQTQMLLVRSREIGERTAQRLNLLEHPAFKGFGRQAPTKQRKDDKGGDPQKKSLGRIARVLQNGLTARNVKDTAVMELSYISSDPKLAADIVNATADSYVEWSNESKMRDMGLASRFLSSQIEQLKSELDEKEKKLTDFGIAKDVYTLDPQANAALSKIDALNKDLSSAVIDRVTKEAKYTEMQNATPESLADTLSGTIVALRNEQAKLEREYEQKLNVYKPEWPAMQQLKLQVTRGRQHLETMIQDTVSKAREVARNELLSAQRREEKLKEELRLQRTEAAKTNSNVVEFTNLRIEVTNKRTLLDSLMKRQSETEVGARLQHVQQDNIRVVDRADVPGLPFFPNYRTIAVQVLVLGLFAGVLLVFFLEYLDRSLKNSEQIEKHLHLPALGAIPSVSLKSRKRIYGYGYGARRSRGYPEQGAGGEAFIELVAQREPRSIVTEAYRAFRTSLLLSRAGGVQTVVVTSAFPGEGKTATVGNLAIVLAQLNKRVLVVDADLHKPRQHEVFGIPNRVGLVSILAERIAYEKAVQPSRTPGLSVVVAGPLSPNPSGLLASEAMGAFLEWARSTYDFVILDSPPVQAVSDALLLGVQSDGVVICVQGGKTPREQVVRVRDRVLRSNARILGVIINRLEEPEGFKGDGSYGYGYGYGYGAQEAKEEQGKKLAANG